MRTAKNMFIALAIALGSCTSHDEATNPVAEAPMMMGNSFETFKLNKSNPEETLKLAGELVPDQQTELFAKVNSYVKRIPVDIGSRVSAGDILVELEAPEIEFQLASAKSKLKAQEAVYIATEANYNRIFKANETQGAIATDVLDQITAKKLGDQAQLESARAAYEEVAAMKNYLVIRAPFNGVITSRNVDLGAYVGPMVKEPLLVVQNFDNLRLSLSVPEAQTPYLNLGDTVQFQVQSLPQHLFAGEISRKAGSLDLKFRSEKIEVDVLNSDGQLKAFMVAEARIPLQNSKETFFIPKSALVDSNLGSYVLRIEEGKTKKVPVIKGRIVAEQIEIFGDLSQGDAVLLKASEEIEEGVTI